jgi:hypothetical protein
MVNLLPCENLAIDVLYLVGHVRNIMFLISSIVIVISRLLMTQNHDTSSIVYLCQV